MLNDLVTSLTQPTASVIVGMLALSGSILVWALGNYATKRREARTRASEARKQFLEKQIAEFYGPLLSLSRRIDAIQDIRNRLVGAFEAKGEDFNGDILVRLRGFIRTEFFMPTHREVQEIIKNRLHLLGEAEMPESFYTYITHTIQIEIQHRLWQEEKIDNQLVLGRPYPETFTVDISAKFAELMMEYRYIQGQERASARDPRPSLVDERLRGLHKS